MLYMPKLNQPLTLLLLVVGIILSSSATPLICQESLKDKDGGCLLMPEIVGGLGEKFQRITAIAASSDYRHQESVYLDANEILEFITKYSMGQLSNSTQPTQNTEAILAFGKTGWGKSTSINMIDGVKFIVNSQGQLEPENWEDIRTMIGNGSGSTTMFPVAIKTKFGLVYDLPGDEQTRGIIPQLINYLSKKQIGKSLKTIKIMLVIPASTFTAEGSYGSEFKKILISVDKYLRGLQKYKENVVIVVSFSRRFYGELDTVVGNVRRCLEHSDGVLEEYREFIEEIIKGNRIKLIAQPSYESRQYKVPQQWVDHQFQSISQTLLTLPSQSAPNPFSVPYNPNLTPKLQSLQKILTHKIKNIIEQSLSNNILHLSGIELRVVKEFLKDVRNSKEIYLGEFVEMIGRYGYLGIDAGELGRIWGFVEILGEFVEDGGSEVGGIKADWITENLEAKLTQIIEEIDQVCQIPGFNFPKTTQTKSLSITPNSPKSPTLSTHFTNLQSLHTHLHSILSQKQTPSSQFYDTKIQQVYDKTISEPYEIQENYVENQSRQKLYKVPKEVEEMVDVGRERIMYRSQVEGYSQRVPRTRQVPRVSTRTVTREGRRRYGICGPREKHTEIIHETVMVDQIYYVDQPRTRTIQVPYTETYIQKIPQKKLIEIDEWRTQQVPIQKTRKVTLYRNKQIFRDEPRRVFNAGRFEQKLRDVEKAIEGTLREIQGVFGDGGRKDLGYWVGIEEGDCSGEFQRKYKGLYEGWLRLEHEALAQRHPQRIPALKNPTK